jgi:hypothetical protein
MSRFVERKLPRMVAASRFITIFGGRALLPVALVGGGQRLRGLRFPVDVVAD